MVRILGDILGSAVYATDGKIGKVTDCYFDEDNWGVRFLLVDAGSWLTNRETLISPHSIERTNLNARRIDLDISKDKVKASPQFNSKPVSRGYEAAYYQYYGYAPYWPEAGPLGPGLTPVIPPGGVEPAPELSGHPGSGAVPTDETIHLRSARHVNGYRVKARNGEIGNLDDLLADEISWMVESAIIDTSNWPGGKPVVIPADRIERVDWSRARLIVNATTHEIRTSPEFETSYARRS